MKVVYRGTQVRFSHTFADGGTPLVPQTSDYPKYAIIDLNGAVVQSGTGLSQGSGVYVVDWFAPLDAELTNEGTNWLIEWVFIDTTGKEWSYTENYEVKDDVQIEIDGREQKFIALAGRPYLSKLQLLLDPYDITLEFMERDNENVKLAVVDKSGLIKRTTQQFHSFETTVSGLEPTQTYVALWTITDTAASTPRYLIQTIMAEPVRTLSMIADVRMLIDKFQKVGGEIQAYEDSDIMEYIKKGGEWVNAVHPATNWNRCSNSPLWGLELFWVMASAWYGLTAQHLLEVDLSFNFTGLTTTLDMDRSSGIEAAIGRMKDFMDSELKPAKMKVYRLSRGNGRGGARAFGAWQNYSNFVYKVSGAGGANSSLRILEGYGIFRG